MIGMSSFAGGGIWNPRAKGPLNIQNNGVPMQSPPLMPEGGGMMPPGSPISASSGMLEKHMGMPTPNAGIGSGMPTANPATNMANVPMRSPGKIFGAMTPRNNRNGFNAAGGAIPRGLRRGIF